MDRLDIRRKIGSKIRMIRGQHENDSGGFMNIPQFCDMLNETAPVGIEFKPQSLGKYERAECSIPGDKLFYIMSFKIEL